MHAAHAKASLASVATTLLDGLTAQLKSRMRESNRAILAEAERMTEKLEAEPQSAEELDELKRYIHEASDADLERLEADVADAGSCAELLHDFNESVCGA